MADPFGSHEELTPPPADHATAHAAALTVLAYVPDDAEAKRVLDALGITETLTNTQTYSPTGEYPDATRSGSNAAHMFGSRPASRSLTSKDGS